MLYYNTGTRDHAIFIVFNHKSPPRAFFFLFFFLSDPRYYYYYHRAVGRSHRQAQSMNLFGETRSRYETTGRFHQHSIPGVCYRFYLHSFAVLANPWVQFFAVVIRLLF